MLSHDCTIARWPAIGGSGSLDCMKVERAIEAVVGRKPEAAAVAKLFKVLAEASPKTFLRSSVKAGIHNADGSLTVKFGGKAKKRR